eukprot:gene40039-48781_t
MELYDEGSVVAKREGTRGFHHSLLLSANFSSPNAIGISDNFDLLFLFLVPKGLYFDDYEILRKFKNVRTHINRDSAPYEDLNKPQDQSLYSLFALEATDLSISDLCPKESWCFLDMEVPIHAAYQAARPKESGENVTLSLIYPFVFVRPSSTSPRPEMSNRCVEVSYLGRLNTMPERCIDCDELLIKTFPQLNQDFASTQYLKIDYDLSVVESVGQVQYQNLHHVPFERHRPRPLVQFAVPVGDSDSSRAVVFLTYLIVALTTYVLLYFMVRVKCLRKVNSQKFK